jgi:hypothetical protein
VEVLAKIIGLQVVTCHRSLGIAKKGNQPPHLLPCKIVPPPHHLPHDDTNVKQEVAQKYNAHALATL